VREKNRATVFQIKTFAAVGFREEAFHFPGARNQLIEFGDLAAREERSATIRNQLGVAVSIVSGLR
jgi:hypothetical protein